MRKLIVAAIGLLVVVGAVLIYRAYGARESVQYRFATVERGDIEQVVTATGSLSSVHTVEVGTQVSGIISELDADFNERVEKGQLLARLDDTVLKIAVRESGAQLAKAKSDLAQAQRQYDRNLKLQAEGVVAQGDLDQASNALDSARAAVQAAQDGLARAQRNLSYATVYSPISGSVVQRYVDVGQTVAASLSAPSLFQIADLSQMQILADVDESDIHQVEPGQSVSFTVQAYSDERFTGKVRQVRLQSKVQENVVTYTAVIDVDPADKPILPGMTATCEFLVAKAENVFVVPNTALRFRPTAEMLAALRTRSEAAAGERPREAGATSAAPSAGARPVAGAAGGSTGAGSGANGRSAGRALPPALWTLDEKGEPRRIRVEEGLTDGQRTQVSGEGLSAGMQVIIGVISGGSAAGTNPFQPQGSAGPRRPGGF